jgi:hypothetical protein
MQYPLHRELSEIGLCLLAGESRREVLGNGWRCVSRMGRGGIPLDSLGGRSEPLAR